MSLVITPKQQKEKELAPTGLQPAVAVDVVDLGIQKTSFGKRSMVSIVFELQAADSEGNHFILMRKYSKSLHPKSNLRGDLEHWRGAPFSDGELQKGFDLEKVVGQPCMLYLEDRDGFIAIESIMPPEGGAVYRPSGQYTRVKDR
ncbi:MAG TPA: hypothetical protein VJ964_00785 [Balneolaceae bacterium]|nr:hypothetical protein [Balneolaceae bacterium]